VRKLFFLLIALFHLQLFALPDLRPSIGVGPMPSDNDSVCYIPWYLGSFYTTGLQAGDTAFDFTLYNLNGYSLNLESALSHGRPVLLIASSYTCPVYRNMVPVINDVVNTYAGLVDVYIIYTIEAHPDIDTSVYFGTVHTGTPNIQAGILYRQPNTYGERKLIITDMLDSMTTLAPVYIDGPCNNWWSTYGPAPNNSYLIDTNGIVFSKHGWFDRFPDNIYCDIDSLLGTSSGNCNSIGGVSNYTFQYTSADTMYDVAGNTISVDAELTNTGVNDILIYARRIDNDMPPGWSSSMCIDVCYSSSTDSVVFLLPAGVTQPVHAYFYTSPTNMATGHVKMGFKNLSDTTNKNFMHAFGITTSITGMQEANMLSVYYSIFPNPVRDELHLNFSAPINSVIQVINIYGKKIFEAKYVNVIDVSNLPPGIYFLYINNIVRRFIKE
jgi:hypothetical protein